VIIVVSFPFPFHCCCDDDGITTTNADTPNIIEDPNFDDDDDDDAAKNNNINKIIIIIIARPILLLFSRKTNDLAFYPIYVICEDFTKVKCIAVEAIDDNDRLDDDVMMSIDDDD
jgi:hypothetical protein